MVAFFPKFFQKLGRKYTMMIGSVCFMLGAALQAPPCPFTLSHTLPLLFSSQGSPLHNFMSEVCDASTDATPTVPCRCVKASYPLQAGAVNMAMLIIGRLFLGVGIGLANQVRLSPLHSFSFPYISSYVLPIFT